MADIPPGWWDCRMAHYRIAIQRHPHDNPAAQKLKAMIAFFFLFALVFSSASLIAAEAAH